MSKEEFIPIVRTMKAVYADPKFIPDESAITVWYELLKDLDSKALMAAVAKYMQTEKFPPFPADLRKMLQTNYMSAEAAWSHVSNALWSCTSYKKAEEAFDRLPEECQRTLGSADALYAYTQGEWNESVNKSLFIKSYNPTVERMQIESRMSPSLRTALGVNNTSAIEDKGADHDRNGN